MSRTATVALFDGPGRPLRVETVNVPDPGPGEILVRVTACTVCGSDLHSVDGRRAVPVPTILGHEIIGEIAAFGPGAPDRDLAGTPLAVGDHVTWAVAASCGRCFSCERDLPQKCEKLLKYGHERFVDRPNGGLASACVLAPGSAVMKLPEGIADARVCPASCATATVAALLAATGNVGRGTFLVQGAGMLGLTACAMARAAGAADVICSDPSAERLARATAFGASHAVAPDAASDVVLDATAGRGVDAVLELSGSPRAFASGVALLRTGGTYVLAGAVFPSPPVPLAMERVVRRMLTIRGVHNYRPRDLRTAVEFLAAHSEFPFETLVDSWYPLADVNTALRHARELGAIRVGVRP